MLIFVVAFGLSVQSSPENVKLEGLRYPARNIRYVGILLLNNPREGKLQEGAGIQISLPGSLKTLRVHGSNNHHRHNNLTRVFEQDGY
jgi:hypothetical protein